MLFKLCLGHNCLCKVSLYQLVRFYVFEHYLHYEGETYPVEGVHLKVQLCFTIAFNLVSCCLVHSYMKKSLALNLHVADAFKVCSGSFPVVRHLRYLEFMVVW